MPSRLTLLLAMNARSNRKEIDMTDISSDSRLTDCAGSGVRRSVLRGGDAIAGDAARSGVRAGHGAGGVDSGMRSAGRLPRAQPQRRRWDRGVHRRVCLRLWAQRGFDPRARAAGDGPVVWAGPPTRAGGRARAGGLRQDRPVRALAGRRRYRGVRRRARVPTATPRGGTCPRGHGRCSGRCWV